MGALRKTNVLCAAFSACVASGTRINYSVQVFSFRLNLSPKPLVAIMEEGARAVLPIKLKVTTFNVLAPCYDETVPNPQDSSQWRSRQEGVLQHIQTLDPDVLCLQEFFFQDDFMQLFNDTLGKLG